MKTFKYIFAAAVAVLSFGNVAAQNDESGYFIDGNLYRHDLNPAFGNDKNYVAMPGVGNINVSMAGNFGVKNIHFNKDGKTTTFLNPKVGLSEFVDGINTTNKLYDDVHVQVLGAGFKGFGGYNTIEINVREVSGVKVPGTLLELAKTGLENKSYDISGLGASARSWAEIAFGHSRQISDQVRIGGKLKILLGGAAADAGFDKAMINLDKNGYTAEIEGQIDGSIKGLAYKTKTENDIHYFDNDGKYHEDGTRTYINDVEVKNSGLNGFGLAMDLGVDYKIDDTWDLSASFTDLGFISWSENHVAVASGNINTNDYHFNASDDAQNSFDKTMDVLADDFSKIYQLQDKGDDGGRTTGIGATMRLGAEYKCPFYDKLSIGLLNTTRFMGDYSWTNFRLSANVAPTKVFSAGGNIAVGTYGASLGGVLNLHLTGFNIFLATDHAIGKMAKQGVPLSSNGSVAMGINFPF